MTDQPDLSTLSDTDQVKRVANALVRELWRQDGNSGEVWGMDNGTLQFIDQGEVDMFELARKAIAAMGSVTR